MCSQMDVLLLDDADDCESPCTYRNPVVHVSDFGYDNGWMVKERDNYYVDDGNDECFTMMMIITIVVLVFHPSGKD